MRYTDKYHLPQWEESDRVLMDDFNQMCADLEDGLAKTAQDAANTANTAAGSAAAAAAKAQTTADTALARANAAQSSANAAFRPGYLPYKTGSYRGNGSTQSINLGFQPSLVIVHHQPADTTIASADTPTLSFTSTGFTVSSGTSSYPNTNTSGYFYIYIAFR